MQLFATWRALDTGAIMTTKRTKTERAMGGGEAPNRRELTRVLDLLAERAVTVRARKRQRIAIGIDSTETLYLVKSGALILNSDCDQERRSILTILYNGDAFKTSSVPPNTKLVLTALVPSVLVRCPWSVFEEMAAKDFSLAQFYMRQSSEQQARQALHVVSLSQLSSEERVAAFLLDIGLRIGTVRPGSLVCDLPLTRKDMADFLALNADTLSRIMSRLKSKGLITAIGRGRLVIREPRELCGEGPVGAALLEMYGRRAEEDQSLAV